MGRERPGSRQASCPGWSGRLLFLAADPLPGSHELPSELADPSRRESVPVRHVQRSLALQEVIDDPTVALAAAADPQREVQPETDLFGHGRLHVVVQPGLYGILRPLAKRD